MTYGPARARYEKRKRQRQRQLANAGFWNVLTIVFSIATLILGGWLVWSLLIEKSISNIFYDRKLQTIFPTLEIPVVAFKSSPQTPGIKITPKLEVLTTTGLESGMNFTFDIQAKPQSISASLFRSERKCNWMGVAGQVFDMKGRPVPGITVQVTGPLNGKEIRFLSLTGAAPWYGEAGYEVFLSDKPFESKDLFQVRLVDQKGRELSPNISFNTSINCEKNLVIINFHQIK